VLSSIGVGTEQIDDIGMAELIQDVEISKLQLVVTGFIIGPPEFLPNSSQMLQPQANCQLVTEPQVSYLNTYVLLRKEIGSLVIRMQFYFVDLTKATVPNQHLLSEWEPCTVV